MIPASRTKRKRIAVPSDSSKKPGSRIAHLYFAFFMVAEKPRHHFHCVYDALVRDENRFYPTSNPASNPTSSSLERPIGIFRSVRLSEQQTRGQKRKAGKRWEKQGKDGKSREKHVGICEEVATYCDGSGSIYNTSSSWYDLAKLDGFLERL